jgi:hypothetical protein
LKKKSKKGLLKKRRGEDRKRERGKKVRMREKRAALFFLQAQTRHKLFEL